MTACSGTPGSLTRALLAGLVTVAVAGCAETVAPDPIWLTIVSGDGQEAEVARALPGPLVVRLSGLNGVPRSGIPVEWTVLEGGGAIGDAAASTDDEGTAQARWTLGPDAGAQSVRVTAGGEGVTFAALAAPTPPSEWADVIEFRPTARLDGDTLVASVWLLNRWPGTLHLKTMSGCFFRSPYPALFDPTGARVAQAFFGCTQAVTTRKVAPADSLHAGWALNVAGVADGEYTLRFRFAVVEINDVPGTLPDVETRVLITR